MAPVWGDGMFQNPTHGGVAPRHSRCAKRTQDCAPQTLEMAISATRVFSQRGMWFRFSEAPTDTETPSVFVCMYIFFFAEEDWPRANICCKDNLQLNGSGLIWPMTKNLPFFLLIDYCYVFW